jgi:hypothetical protein
VEIRSRDSQCHPIVVLHLGDGANGVSRKPRGHRPLELSHQLDRAIDTGA